MSGTAAIIRARFLKKTSGSYEVKSGVPAPTSLNLHLDINSFTLGFDMKVEVDRGEEFLLQSHDLVEFYVLIDGEEVAIATGVIEDFLDTTTETQTTLTSSGRGLLSQLIYTPWTKLVYANQSLSILELIRKACFGMYVEAYAKFKGQNMISDLGAYPGRLLVSTNAETKRSATLQANADLALNLVYENDKGQIEVYGRNTETNVLGTLTTERGKANVSDISVKQCMSKVISSCTVMWVQGENMQNAEDIASPRFVNTDQRVTDRGIYHPELKVFSASDMQGLAGQVAPEKRVADVAQSAIRRSNQNLQAVVIDVKEPFYTDEKTGEKTVFKLLQDWRVVHPKRGIDTVMRIAGIVYAQSAGEMSIQLQLFEPDTLI